MFSYTREQKTYELDDIKVGGQPGEFPTLMFGTIFYEGQFEDRTEAEEKGPELIKRQNEFSSKTSVSSLTDIFIFEKEEVEWKIDLALEHTERFFSVDVPEAEVRMKVLDYLEEKNALDRVIYNSLNLGVTDDEIEKLRHKPPAGAVLLGYNPQNNGTQGRMDIIKEGGKLMEEGLLPLADELDIEYKFLDTAATPFGEKAGETLRAVPVFKDEFGLPVGCALHNTVESWSWLNEYEKKDDIFQTLDTSIDNLPVLLGADFIYYGPIENASTALSNMAMVDKLIAEGAEDYFGIKIDEKHPHHLL